MQKTYIKTKLVYLITLMAVWASPVSGAKKPFAEQYQYHFQQAEYYMSQYQFEDSIKHCEKALQYKESDYLIRAIMCLNYYEIAEQKNVKDTRQKSEKIQIYEKMVKIAEQGIQYAPDQGECYFFRGVAHARLSTTNGILYSLFMAKNIENDWLKAVQSKSEYVTPTGENLLASSHMALGSYYRLCPSFFLLTWLFGISGDLDKSVDHGITAYALDPRIEVTKEYGISMITRGLARHSEKDINEGKRLLAKIPSLPLRLKTDSVDIEHSRLLLADINLCPGYSRDQQQELSETAFKSAREK